MSLVLRHCLDRGFNSSWLVHPVPVHGGWKPPLREIQAKSIARSLLAGIAIWMVADCAAGAAIEVEHVAAMSPRNQAAWWSPIAYRDGAIYVSYLSPNAPQDDVYVGMRSPNGTWTLRDTGFDAVYDVGHTQTSLAIDGDGYVHLFYGMHGNSIRYARSNQPASVSSGFQSMSPSAFAGGSYTYPNVTTAPNGDLYLIIRDRRSSYVSSGQDGRLLRYTDATNTWSALTPFAGQAGATVYPDHVFADDSGQVHILWEWAAGGPQGSRHYGSYARFDSATNKYFRADGTAYAAAPISVGTADIYQGLEGAEVFAANVHGVQAAKMALDEQGRPLIAYSYSLNGTDSGYEHRFARWTGEQWVHSTITAGPFDIDKSWLGYSDGLLRYYGTLSPSDPNHNGHDDIYLRTSADMGATWSAPVPVTVGRDIQRPVGITVGNVDYLYLPSVDSGQLYLATVDFSSKHFAPGDFSRDGKVDGADFAIWQEYFPRGGDATPSQGDGDGDGDVDGADFVIWQTGLSSAASSPTQAVPELSGFELALGNLLAVAASIVRRARTWNSPMRRRDE